MGTKLDYSISLLANAQSSHCGFNLNCVHEWDFFRNKLLKSNLDCSKLQESLDTTMEQQNIESIKKAILIHEDIFKHQVRELHRLYSVQKLLMNELKNELKQQPYLRDLAPQSTSWSCPADNSLTSRRFNLECPAAYDESSTRVMAPQQGQTKVLRMANNNDGCEEGEEAEVELTLSIGVGGSSTTTTTTNKKKRFRNEQMICNYELDCSRSTTHNRIGSSSSVKSDRGEECIDLANTMSSSSGASDEERKRPHWLFRSLSLNKT